jgi:hypothetical protein
MHYHFFVGAAELGAEAAEVLLEALDTVSGHRLTR